MKKSILVILLYFLITLNAAESNYKKISDWLHARGHVYSEKQLSRITGLKLKGLKIDDKDLLLLSGLSTLKWLEIRGKGITDKGIAFLTNFTELRVLKLGKTSITDKAMNYLLKLKHLQVLEIAESPITDDGLLLLSKIKTLRSLYIPYDIDRKTIRQLEADLPHCKVRSKLLGLIDPKVLPGIFIGTFIVFTLLIVFLGTSAKGKAIWTKVKKVLSIDKPGRTQFVFAAPLITIFLLLMITNILLLTSGETTTGEVVKLILIKSTSKGKTSITYKPKVRFVTKKGQTVFFTANHSSNPPSYDLGEPVSVLYSPENPRWAIIKNFGGTFGLFSWSLAFVGGALVLIIIGIRKKRRLIRQQQEGRNPNR